MNTSDIFSGAYGWAHPSDQINYVMAAVPGSTATEKPSMGFLIGAALPIAALMLFFGSGRR